MGVIIIATAILYLLRSLYNLYKYQKDLLYVSDKIESFQSFIKTKEFLKDTLDLLISIVKLYKTIKTLKANREDEEPAIIKIKRWANKHLTRSEYLTRVGFSIFKIYLTLKLIFIVFTTILFLTIVNANYFMQLQQLKIISSSIASFPQYLLLSFYICLGQPLDKLNILLSANYLSSYLFVIGIVAWGIGIIYILLFIDIIATSLSNFYDTSITTVKSLVAELLRHLNNLPPENVDS